MNQFLKSIQSETKAIIGSMTLQSAQCQLHCQHINQHQGSTDTQILATNEINLVCFTVVSSPFLKFCLEIEEIIIHHEVKACICMKWESYRKKLHRLCIIQHDYIISECGKKKYNGFCHQNRIIITLRKISVFL